MKACIITDIHFGYSNNNEELLNGTIDFFEKQFIPHCEKENIQRVFIAGDVFESRNTLNVRTIKEAKRIIKKLADVVPVFIIVGNHDLYYKNSLEVDSLVVFEDIPDVQIIREFNYIENVFMIPWVIEGEEIHAHDFLSRIKRTDFERKLLIGHFDIKGFAMNAGKNSEKGFEFADFDTIDLVVSGHYHTRSIQTLDGSTIIYLGSPYQLNRGDIGESRGFMQIDTETLEYTFIENMYSPKFLKLEFPEGFQPCQIPNNFVDIVVKCTNDRYNEKALEKYIEQIEALGPVVPPRIQIVSSKSDDVEFDITLENMASTVNLIKDYIDVAYADDVDDIESVYKRVMEVYEKVNG